jgi:hypothetical protein
MASISRSISPTCGMIDSKQSMAHIRLYREGGRYVESAKKKEEKKKEKEKIQ